MTATNTNDELVMDPSFKIYNLPNKMKIYIKLNKTPRKSCELRLLVKAGSLHESDNELGLAHFCEHLAFRQTRNFTDGKIVDTLEKFGTAFGADINASTTFTETVYQLCVPTDKEDLLNLAFAVLAEWARGVSPSHKIIQTEKKVVLEEWRECQTGAQRLYEEAFGACLKGSRYPTRMPIGRPAIIKALTVEDCLRFYHTWYRPEFMAVVAVGDFEDFGQVQALVEQYLAPLVPHPEYPSSPLPESTVPCVLGERVLIQSDPEGTRCSVSVSVKSPYVVRSPRDQLMEDLQTGILFSILRARLELLSHRQRHDLRETGPTKTTNRASQPMLRNPTCEFSRLVPPVLQTTIEADRSVLIRRGKARRRVLFVICA